MQTFDRIQVLGVCGRDPEMRYTPSGDPVTTLSVAASNSYKKKDSEDWVTQTRWYRVTIWGKQAEWVNENFAKSDGIYFEGRLQADENGNPRIWEGQDGKAHSSFEVKADLVRMTGKSKNANGTTLAKETEEETEY